MKTNPPAVFYAIRRQDTGQYWAGADDWRDSPDDALTFSEDRDAFVEFVTNRSGQGEIYFDIAKHKAAQPAGAD